MESTIGENEKQLLAATVRERLIGKKNCVLYRELLDEKIPTFLKNYLRNNVRKYIHTEEPVQLKYSKRYDYEYGNITEIHNSLIKALEEATIFQREELEEIINKTVVLQFDLLVRPNVTLLGIFFKNKAERIKSEILQVLKGLEDNRIFISKLIEKINSFDQDHIVEDDCSKILNETEKEIYENNFLNAFISDVKVFSQFMGMIRGYDNQKIKIELINLLLDERNLGNYIAAFDILSKDSIEINDIYSILSNFINNKEQGQEKKNSLDDIDNFIMVPVSKDDVDNNGSDPDLIQLADDTEEKISLISKQKLKENNNSEKKKNNRVTKITNIHQDPYDLIIKRSKIEEQPDITLDSLKNLIDEKSEKFIIKRIFNNEQVDYHQFIDNLNIIESWKEAKETIDKELFLRSIKPFSKEALRLGDLVFNRYFPKKQV